MSEEEFSRLSGALWARLRWEKTLMFRVGTERCGQAGLGGGGWAGGEDQGAGQELWLGPGEEGQTDRQQLRPGSEDEVHLLLQEHRHGHPLPWEAGQHWLHQVFVKRGEWAGAISDVESGTGRRRRRRPWRSSTSSSQRPGLAGWSRAGCLSTPTNLSWQPRLMEWWALRPWWRSSVLSDVWRPVWSGSPDTTQLSVCREIWAQVKLISPRPRLDIILLRRTQTQEDSRLLLPDPRPDAYFQEVTT